MLQRLTDADLAAYLADNYGRCTASPCRCLKSGWLGRACPNWRPAAARDWEEMQAMFPVKPQFIP